MVAVAVAAAVGIISGSATGDPLNQAVPQEVIRQALACTTVPLWLQQATPIQTLRDAPGPSAFFYPYNHTIYLRAGRYLRRGNRWDVSRLAVVLGHEFGHAFQRIAAPFGSHAWQEFERLTPGFENGPLGERTYQTWRRNRGEAFAEAYRLLFGGIGAKVPSLVPISITPAIRAYFHDLNAAALDVSLRQGLTASEEMRGEADIARPCVSAAGVVHAGQPELDFAP